jgi:hypothetical protein
VNVAALIAPITKVALNSFVARFMVSPPFGTT